MKTALITGSSSGFGKATAQLFLNNGWNVVATMGEAEGRYIAIGYIELWTFAARPKESSSALQSCGAIDAL
jgi:NAD(P)-dependent dehydrogenase (short-subunit alcohol dehydrogenase family)